VRSERLTILYGIASAASADIDEFFLTLDEAETVLAAVITDEPDFEGTLWIEAVEFETHPS
jgi:hypothetical protein